MNILNIYSVVYCKDIMIKRKNQSPPGRSRKDQPWKASDDLLTYLKNDYPEKMPIPYLTAITKKYNKERVLH